MNHCQGGKWEFEDKWPCEIRYNQHKPKDAQEAARFLSHRPMRLFCKDGEFFSEGGDGLWVPITEAQLTAEIVSTAALGLRITFVARMVQALRALCHVETDFYHWFTPPAPEFANASDLALTGTGIVNVVTRRQRTFYDGAFFATARPSFPFERRAKCPLWLEKLREWLDPVSIQTLQQFFGYCLVADNSHEKILVLLGAPRGGKSTIAAILQALIGSHLYISRSIQDLGNDFGLEGAQGKRVIFIPDAKDGNSFSRPLALGRLKNISGNDEVSINRKNRPIITDTLPAKIVITANRFPKFLDDSGGLSARLIVLEFENTFAAAPDLTLRKRLLAELSGIFNWALDGLVELRSQSHFTMSEKSLAAGNRLALAQSVAARFAEECLQIVPGDFGSTVFRERVNFVSIDDMFGLYDWWAYAKERLGKERRNRTDFGEDLQSAILSAGVRKDRGRVRDFDQSSGPGRPRRGWFGVRIRKAVFDEYVTRNADYY